MPDSLDLIKAIMIEENMAKLEEEKMAKDAEQRLIGRKLPDSREVMRPKIEKDKKQKIVGNEEQESSQKQPSLFDD
jgi:hypothetical protein